VRKILFLLITQLYTNALAGDTHAAEANDVARLDIGCTGSAVQSGWIAWNVGSGKHWNERGPFTIRVDGVSFDPDGFTVTLGPKGAIGYRAGPACSGPLGAVLQESLFTWATNPFVITLSGLAKGSYRIVTWHNDSRGYVWPPFDISVTDRERREKLVVRAQRQTSTRHSNSAARAEFMVTSDGVHDVTIRTHLASQERVYVFLNAIEIARGTADTEQRRGGIGSILGIPGAWTGGYEKQAGTKCRDLRADVCVVGGGRGGIGAAIAAARAGASVILIDRTRLPSRSESASTKLVRNSKRHLPVSASIFITTLKKGSI